MLERNRFQQFGGAESYVDLLSRSLPQAYRFFGFLAQKFNGDMFPVTPDEEGTVGPNHLALLSGFLVGTEMPTGQTYFWAYDFAYIPIELISSIYEEFLHKERKKTGAYYTPPEIVDFVLNDVLPWEGPDKSVRILDPACGSGIFLVEAYRRLVYRKLRAQFPRRLSPEQLCDVLTASIFGVDIQEEAVRVAAFSLYLALLEWLEPKSIWASVRFPTLLQSNLFPADFFDATAAFNEQRYDIVIGNPPWKSKLDDLAGAYVSRASRPVGDQQIAQAFLWRAPDMLSPGGKGCLLVPSKPVLFNRSQQNRAFRSQFFADREVTEIVNFSPFRRSLFQNSTAPMAAIFFKIGQSDEKPTAILRYLTPQPSPMAASLAGVVISGDEIRRISSRRIASNPDVLRLASWGTPRDLGFLDDLRERFATLGAVADGRGWAVHEGLQKKGSGRHEAPDLATKRYIPADALQPFCVTSDSELRLDSQVFHRIADRRIYEAPHVLLRRGVQAGGVIASAFVPYDAVFTHSIIGIAGPDRDAAELKIICAYLNSSLTRYYQFLNSVTWGVERDEVQLSDHRSFPCALPLEEKGLAWRIAGFVDSLQQSVGPPGWQSELDDLVFAAYRLSQAERQLIYDTITFTVGRYHQDFTSQAFAPPTNQDLVAYAEALAATFGEAVGTNARSLIPTVYVGHAPYRVVSFHPGGEATSAERRGRAETAVVPGLDQVLNRLEQVMLERYSDSVYLRRSVKMFEGETLYIIKPGEKRYWTKTAAFNDADEMVGRLLRFSGLV